MPHILVSVKGMYVTNMVIMLKYSKHSSPMVQEKSLTAILCTKNRMKPILYQQTLAVTYYGEIMYPYAYSLALKYD